MFTIRHEKSDGTTEVFSAVEVQHIPRVRDNPGSHGVHLLCGPGQGSPGVRVGRITDGTVFVMNDAGKTVSKFDLVVPPPAPKG